MNAGLNAVAKYSTLSKTNPSKMIVSNNFTKLGKER